MSHFFDQNDLWLTFKFKMVAANTHLIIFFILKSAMKYWVRLQTIHDKSTLLYKTFRENIDLALHNKYCWLSNIQRIYNTTIKQETWTKNEGKINKLPHLFYNTVADTFDTTWKRNLESNTSKLRTYKTFKKEFKLENYKHRKELTKLRISAHSLQIEKGRYHRPQKNPYRRRVLFTLYSW